MSTQRTRQEWLALIKDQQTSGLTIADYAKRHGLSVPHFYTRRKRRLNRVRRLNPTYSH